MEGSVTQGSSPTAPGWYSDPSDPGQLRYWSGSAWSQERQPAPLPPGSPFSRPWWQEWWAIVLTLLLCFPLGVIGVWQRKETSVAVKAAVSVVAAVLYAVLLMWRASRS
jgi:hypothetical protein